MGGSLFHFHLFCLGESTMVSSRQSLEVWNFQWKKRLERKSLAEPPSKSSSCSTITECHRLSSPQQLRLCDAKKINIVREYPDIITTREAHAEFSHEQPIDWRPSSCWSKHCKSGFLRCYNCNLRLTTFALDTTQHQDQTWNNFTRKWFSAEIVSSFPFNSEVGIYREHSYWMSVFFLIKERSNKARQGKYNAMKQVDTEIVS